MARKGDKKTGRKTGKLVPQKHGGAILDGAPHPDRQVPGPGRPPSAVRKRLTKIVDEVGVEYVRRVLEGKEEGASIADRLAAFDKAAKYGMGTTKELTVEHVRDRLEQTIRVVEEHMGEDAPALLDKIEPIWQ
jgi:hypothetical protein